MREPAHELLRAHYVLLSAICVQKPLLEFQRAKLKLEEAITSQGDVTYSIVRPTAFFKSLAGQVNIVKGGPKKKPLRHVECVILLECVLSGEHSPGRQLLRHV